MHAGPNLGGALIEYDDTRPGTVRVASIPPFFFLFFFLSLLSSSRRASIWSGRKEYQGILAGRDEGRTAGGVGKSFNEEASLMDLIN